MKSGSLITARIANEMGRDVYAVPGSIFSKTSAGCNLLIAEMKANLVTGPEDILGLPKESQPEQVSLFEDLTPEQREIIKILEREEASIDEISKELYRPSFEVASELSVLGITGHIEETSGKFRLTRS